MTAYPEPDATRAETEAWEIANGLREAPGEIAPRIQVPRGPARVVLHVEPGWLDIAALHHACDEIDALEARP